ncbi:transcriptional regulator [Leucobacter sp. OLJS4]|uniref:ArsR/SmtB family transcription factor n=1 Tax=unclassified Leucobacter TaxID=2621730 RepID=UPI000C19A93C|nr:MULTISPECIES: helix-turn-helix domain-containing protein [unclassified Leucobacter]PII82761.1 transcriptional regulator [Leucobacter sp. OLCALW19]PII88132.1 transcriptional regulator [Leucobacter sp. OLTLW20]PII91990.1 transcriptional regulator [Leucobacter sp. OLAS13]PIJ00312.1 transcriptional regulator [Leucobacter sp. OLDS2]PIJ02563.1 transcriptional regulator [Leucobacter sp. OLCS4]
MTEPETHRDLHLDERAVRVLAHPLRSRLLGELRLHGPATATRLAETLGTNTGATSYHLRALETVGLVTDTGEGAGRRRLWAASTESHSWTNSDFAGDDDAQAALGWLRRDYVRQFAVRAEQWLDAEPEWPAEWVDLLGHGDSLLVVTPAQLAAFRAELDALLEKYRAAGEGDPGARRLHFVEQTMPIDPSPPVAVEGGSASEE